MSNHKSILILLALIYCSVFYAQNETGLLFKSTYINKDQRTSLHLTSNSKFVFNSYFSLEFYIRLQERGDKFGYICRIINGENSNFDILLNNSFGEDPNLNLVVGKTNLFKLPLTNSHFRLKTWNRIKLTLDKNNKTLIFRVNDTISTLKYTYPSNRDLDVCFGMNQSPPFITSDVASIILKNVAVSFKPDEIKYLWKLNKHGQNIVYDDNHSKEAKVLNPIWLIDSHILWGNHKQLNFPSKVFTVFDEDKTLYLISTNKIYKYNLLDGVITEYRFSPAIPINSLSNQFIFNTRKRQIEYYDFEFSKPVISHFNFSTKSWDVSIVHKNGPSYQHHNLFYSPIDSSVFQIFGYGFHLYRSDVKKLTAEGKLLSKSFLPVISPRYLSAVGVKDSLLYIYGGVGNQNGRQEFGTQLYNDLYCVNLRNLQVTKKWGREITDKNEIAARTLVLDSASRKGYALFFNPTRFSSYLILNEIDLQNPITHSLADTIPYYFQDTESEASLFYSKPLQKLFTVTIHKSENNFFHLNVYEISYPVFSANDVLQSVHNKYYWWYLGIIFLFLCLIAFLYLRLRNRKKTNNVTLQKNVLNDNDIKELLSQTSNETKMPGIHLLGGFQVIDKNNHDITGEFTPVMKQILSLIILYTCKDGKGISNVKLKDILWYDKSEESARNNRSVNISKIRLLLSSISNFEISNENSYWSIEFKDDAYCDYVQSLLLISDLQKNKNINSEQLISVLSIISSGELLPNIQEDWMDKFKSGYSNLVIDVLLSLKDHVNLIENPKLLIVIADTILVLDTLNEDAILLKCKALVKIGRVKIAKDVFDSFNKEYKLLMNEEFSKSFDNFIKQ